jgi:hypothetical protein
LAENAHTVILLLLYILVSVDRDERQRQILGVSFQRRIQQISRAGKLGGQQRKQSTSVHDEE